ncbi:hypothetical protein [Shewanella sp. LZH-2]|uniref:hypothetical protein n=1 Tax=Shewanella sp. LZH-2 TaxID=2806008 RepID=UPI00193DF0DB|nr:hypothetical protein [Shewanella sp. LZH-2]QRK80176.1 hypothetical protein JM642_03425 [Shewanella sp. LZH-2]
MEKEFIGLLGVVVGFMLNLAYGAWDKRNQRKQEQYYLAVMVTMHLDRFFDEAVFVCGDNGQPNQDGYYYPKVVSPKIELPSKDVDWRSLPQELMREILWLPERIHDAEGYIDGVREHAAFPPDFEEFFEARQYEFAKLALLANKLSIKLRKVAKLPLRTIGDQYYDPVTSMIKLVAEIDKRRDDRAITSRRMSERILATKSATN